MGGLFGITTLIQDKSRHKLKLSSLPKSLHQKCNYTKAIFSFFFNFYFLFLAVVSKMSPKNFFILLEIFAQIKLLSLFFETSSQENKLFLTFNEQTTSYVYLLRVRRILWARFVSVSF